MPDCCADCGAPLSAGPAHDRAACHAAVLAQRDALRVALNWALAEGGWRLWYFGAWPYPPGLIPGEMGSPARWQWPPEGSGDE